MFEKLFAESGLSLDRLRAMLEVAACGSIAKATGGDPVRQSQYSRQIKELEDFFRVKLMERDGKGMQLTSNGRELARLSRFFLLGLSNFQRGCLAEEQTCRIGASATFIQCMLVPALGRSVARARQRYVFEVVSNDDIERRLHDLTLDFGIVTSATLSRPLQTTKIGESKLILAVPRRLSPSRSHAAKAFRDKSLPLAMSEREMNSASLETLKDYQPSLICDSFLTARAAMQEQHVAAILPDFLSGQASEGFWQIRIPMLDSCVLKFNLAWNPRLLRLNPQIVRTRDFLENILTAGMRG
jgi:DNA-binding transcriptional LysR family regulator